MKETIKNIKKFYYENLFILKDIQTIDEIENRVEENKIAKIKLSDLKSVCNDCDNNIKCNLMSGFSHTEDLLKNVGKIDFQENEIYENPIMFLCENPGKNHFEKSEKYFEKMISFHSLNYWFSKKSDFRNNDNSLKKLDNFSNSSNDAYAYTFAHLISKYNLSNVFITNTIKCKPTDNVNFNKIKPELNTHCLNKFLKKEIEIIKPKLIVCFGENAYKNYLQIANKDDKIKVIKLLHPSIRGKTITKYKEKFKNDLVFKESKLKNVKMKILQANYYKKFDNVINELKKIKNEQ